MKTNLSKLSWKFPFAILSPVFREEENDDVKNHRRNIEWRKTAERNFNAEEIYEDIKKKKKKERISTKEYVHKNNVDIKRKGISL